MEDYIDVCDGASANVYHHLFNMPSHILLVCGGVALCRADKYFIHPRPRHQCERARSLFIIFRSTSFIGCIACLRCAVQFNPDRTEKPRFLCASCGVNACTFCASRLFSKAVFDDHLMGGVVYTCDTHGEKDQNIH